MKNSKKKLISMLLVVTMLVMLFATGCSSKKTEPADTTTDAPTEATTEAPTEEVTEAPEDEATPTDEEVAPTEEPTDDTEDVTTGGKQVITYFANWNLGEKEPVKAEVAGIPWDAVTIVNHAFFRVAPNDGTTETSFERKANGDAARTEFVLESTNPYGDFEDDEPSELLPNTPRNHFAEYGVMKEQYPDVKVVISVGGWSDCGYFSEMAYTPEGRASFIQSCTDLIKEYPWIDGIDIDWEYPGCDPDGERYPEDESDQGCPIWGAAVDDSVNFAALCSEMRDTFNAEFGEGTKLITACASASTGWTLPCCNWKLIEPYLDYINIMTYDLAGSWDGVTGYATSLDGARGGFVYFSMLNKEFDMTKFNIGSPLYSTYFQMTDEAKIDVNVVGAEIDPDNTFICDFITQTELMEFEKEAVSGYTTVYEDGKAMVGEEFDNGGQGWHFAYNDKAGASYMWNDDPESEYYRVFLSYESPVSLQSKLDFINRYGMGGIIIWETSQDAEDYPMIRQMGTNLK